MPQTKRWTEETLLTEAKKYSNRQEFREKNASALTVARRLGILDEICSHMSYLCGTGKKPVRFSKEDLATEAKKYKFRSDFLKFSHRHYNVACKRGLLDEICAHMLQHKNLLWSDDALISEAKKYKTRKEFRENNAGAYSVVKQRKLLDAACAHMSRISLKGIPKKWSDEQIIAEARKYKTKHDLVEANPSLQTLICRRKLSSVAFAHMDLESPQYVKPRFWTTDRILNEARKCRTLQEFRCQYQNAYDAASRYGVIADVHSILKPSKVYKRRTDEDLLSVAKKYKNKVEFTKHDYGAIQALAKRGLLESACSHMLELRSKKYTKEQVQNEAFRYSTRTEFCDYSQSHYHAAIVLGILDDVCLHMDKPGNRYKRCVYRIYNKDTREIYIGLTCYFEKRDHLKSRRPELVNLRKNGVYERLTSYLDADVAAKIENTLILHYRNTGNWRVVNIKNGGELGAGKREPSVVVDCGIPFCSSEIWPVVKDILPKTAA